MFHHIIKFYLYRRNILKKMYQRREYWTYRGYDALIVGYISAVRITASLPNDAVSHAGVRRWAGVA